MCVILTRTELRRVHHSVGAIKFHIILGIIRIKAEKISDREGGELKLLVLQSENLKDTIPSNHLMMMIGLQQLTSKVQFNSADHSITIIIGCHDLILSHCANKKTKSMHSSG